MDAGKLKTLISYVAPMILATIAKQFSGKSLTAPDLSSFFAEQKSNITAALPPGLSLASIPGLTGSATGPIESSGLPGWLLPLVGLGLLGALAWYFFGNQAAEVKPVDETQVAVKPAPAPVEVKQAEPKASKEPVIPKVDLTAIPDPTKIGTDLTSVFASLTDILGGVKDVPTAQAAAPKLTDLTPKLDSLKSLWDKVPAAGKSAITKIATDHLGKLKELVTKVLAIPGVSEKLKPVLDILVDKLTAFTVS